MIPVNKELLATASDRKGRHAHSMYILIPTRALAGGYARRCSWPGSATAIASRTCRSGRRSPPEAAWGRLPKV